MNLVKVIKDTGKILFAFDEVYFNKSKLYSIDKKNIYTLRGDKIVKTYSGKTWHMVFKGDHIFAQANNGSELFALDRNFNKRIIVKGTVYMATIRQNLHSHTKYYVPKGDDLRYHWISLSLEASPVVNHFDLEFPNGYVFKGFNKTKIQGYDLKENLIWEVDTSLNLFPKQSKNEIHRNIFGNSTHVFVPLKNGFLIALDSSTGKEYWRSNIGTGSFNVFRDKIYQNYGRGLLEIDSNSGKILRNKIYKDDLKSGDFHAIGGMWVDSNYIILKYQSNGHILFINRQTFQVEKSLKTDIQFASGEDNLIWHKKKLYLLSLANELHIYSE